MKLGCDDVYLIKRASGWEFVEITRTFVHHLVVAYFISWT
jgi:hypothetical protein